MKLIQTTLVLAAMAVLLPAAQAQSQIDELRLSLQERMPAVLGKDNTDLANKLLSIKPDGAISKNFNAANVIAKLMGRGTKNFAADCAVKQTTQKEPDAGPCVVEVGSRDDPTGAYSYLAYSKNTGLGKIKFIKRAAFTVGDKVDAKPVTMSDEKAYAMALDTLSLLGVPLSEIPKPPAGAKVPFPVRSLAVGGGLERGDPSLTTVIRKSVFIPRGFAVPGGLYKDPVSGVTVTHVPAPGGALVTLDDSGPQLIQVRGWSDAQIDTSLNPRRAKSLDALLDEISEDLYSQGVRKAGSLGILIGLRQGYPNPDDPNPVFCPVCGVLRPALIVTISSAPAGKVKAITDETGFNSAAGLVREYDLIEDSVDQPAR